jgi:ADP-heptose:LPS heptosyltransferase
MIRNVSKILIIRFSSIGDIVLTTPVIRCLKQQLPLVKVYYLTKSGFRQVLENNPYIDCTITFDKSLSEVKKQLITEDFDLIIDLHHNLSTLKVKNWLKVPSYSFPKLNVEKWLLVNLKLNKLPNTHIVDRYLETTKSLEIINDQKGLDYFIPKEDVVDIKEELPTDFHAGYVGLVIGAQHFTKRLPNKKLIELCSIIDKPVVLMGGPMDKAVADEILQNSDGVIFNSCGLFNLNQSASLVKQAKVVVSHDTGLMHIAAAFNKPIISIWGNTVPEFGMYPYKVTNEFRSEIKELACRPCSKIGHNKCPLGHFKCMEQQDLKEISRKITQFWN